ncbi:hypothetical protein [uncultured Aquimarina sp.]|uniref:hypothetical protein n=1 Tax=uncultured Aquimarina sp. TaxID=575652 RepID=UPI00260608F3|nr:hypothetical protein [uncultured Aquimarina sp.]
MTFSKTIPFFIIILLVCIQCKKEDPSINLLSAPDNWRKETIKFPLSFAPSLSYKGTEYVRFAPGWSKQDSKEYFSYAFLWYLDEDPKLSTSTLESELEIYFNGLVQAVSEPNSPSLDNIPKAKAFFEQIDNHSYAGKVLTYDPFTTKKGVNLNIIVTYTPCEKIDEHLVVFRISPQQIDHPVWDKLNEVKPNIDCE